MNRFLLVVQEFLVQRSGVKLANALRSRRRVVNLKEILYKTYNRAVCHYIAVLRYLRNNEVSTMFNFQRSFDQEGK